MRIKINSAVPILILFVILSSCVSSKKYTQAVYQRDNLQDEIQHTDQQLKNTEAQRDSLSRELQYIKGELGEEISQKQLALKEKDEELQRREQLLEDLKEALNLQQDAVVNLKQQVCDALKCYTPDELSIEVRDGKLYVSLSDKLLFASGSDKINDRGEEAIKMLADVLVNSDMEIMVEGHTDTVPINNDRNKDNWDLSVHRATSVTRLLTKYEINPESIIASGRSKYHPLATNQTEDGRKLNRRTDIVLAPKLDKLWKLTESDPQDFNNYQVTINNTE